MGLLTDFVFFTFVAIVTSRSIDINDPIFGQPEQIHLSYGLDPSLMIVTWITFNPINDSVVEYGADEGLDLRATGTVSIFQDGGTERRREYVHRVVLRNLIPGQRYFYHCGSDLYGWSPVFWFSAMRNDSDFVVRAAVYGDMGRDNAQSIPRLQDETQRGHFDLILHVGDMAYDMDSDNARVGDDYMNAIQSLAAYIPYMVCPGNHENAYNFSQYGAKFSMPSLNETYGDNANHFYSFNVGSAHIIGFSTEFYYYLQYGYDQIANQYKWLEDDLREATKPENRARHPWIIAMGHKPMYCTNNDDQCLDHAGYAAVHNGTKGAYIDPDAPVHIVTGSAGCSEKHASFGSSRPWTAFRSTDYGYSRMNIYNATHLYFEQVSDDQKGRVIDHMWLIKSKHGPYSYI